MTYDDIKSGDRVTILVPNGKKINWYTRLVEVEWAKKTGRAVMRGPAGWVLNMGGKHGTPGIATPDNFVEVKRGKLR